MFVRPMPKGDPGRDPSQDTESSEEPSSAPKAKPRLETKAKAKAAFATEPAGEHFVLRTRYGRGRPGGSGVKKAEDAYHTRRGKF